METQTAEKPKQEIQKKPHDDERSVEFVPFGAVDKIRLTAAMVRSFIAVPTKSGALPDERMCIKFIMLCRGKKANPFEGDCFMIGYDTQSGPSFSMVCGIDLFLKRAEQSEDYDGRESGVIVMGVNEQLAERPGSLVLDGEKLIGGWARVHRKNHTHPEYKAVKFSTYNTGRSRWEKDPGGMIEKVALSQALRSAYPTALGGLYVQEEMQRITETGEGLLSTKDIAIPKALPGAASYQSPVQENPVRAPAKEAPAPKQEPTEPDTLETRTGSVQKVEDLNAGKKGKKPDFRITIDNNTVLETRDVALASVAEEFRQSGSWAQLTWQVQGQTNILTKIE